MMNNEMGFFGSNLAGFPPSRTPPCGAARLELEAVPAVPEMVLVTISVSVVVAIAAVG
jgi:hypothetical protein